MEKLQQVLVSKQRKKGGKGVIVFGKSKKTAAKKAAKKKTAPIAKKALAGKGLAGKGPVRGRGRGKGAVMAES